MKKVKEQLKGMAKALASLSKQVDKLSKHVDKMATTKTAKKPKGAAVKTRAKAVKKPKAAAVKTRAKSSKSKTKPVKAAVKKKAAPKAKAGAAKKAPKKVKGKAPSVLDTVLGTIKKSRSGITIAQLRAKTGFHARQVSNALYKLTQKGAVETKSRGIYTGKK